MLERLSIRTGGGRALRSNAALYEGTSSHRSLLAYEIRHNVDSQGHSIPSRLIPGEPPNADGHYPAPGSYGGDTSEVLPAARLRCFPGDPSHRALVGSADVIRRRDSTRGYQMPRLTDKPSPLERG